MPRKAQESEDMLTQSSLTSTNTQLEGTNTQLEGTNTQLENTNPQLVANSNVGTVRSKLPKLILPKFKGEVTNYRAFLEIFESAVHNNTQLTVIDKFNYLVLLLEQQALRSTSLSEVAQ